MPALVAGSVLAESPRRLGLGIRGTLLPAFLFQQLITTIAIDDAIQRLEPLPLLLPAAARLVTPPAPVGDDPFLHDDGLIQAIQEQPVIRVARRAEGTCVMALRGVFVSMLAQILKTLLVFAECLLRPAEFTGQVLLLGAGHVVDGLHSA